MTQEKEQLVNALMSLFDMHPTMKVSMENTSIKVLKAFLEGAIVNSRAYNTVKQKQDDYRKRLASYETIVDWGNLFSRRLYELDDTFV